MKFPILHVWKDTVFRSPESNMALDEALFQWSASEGRAVARFYHWDRPAFTTGYFLQGTRRNDTSMSGPVRRFTGGGLVEHGEDLTFLLTFPQGSEAALANGSARYRWVHEALAASLFEAGHQVTLQPETASSFSGPCFANPVPWDLIEPESGIKIGGGAQRRSRGAVIHQGSVRLPKDFRNPMANWIDSVLARLAHSVVSLDSQAREQALSVGLDLETNRYGTPLWNRQVVKSAGKLV